AGCKPGPPADAFLIRNGGCFRCFVHVALPLGLPMTYGRPRRYLGDVRSPHFRSYTLPSSELASTVATTQSCVLSKSSTCCKTCARCSCISGLVLHASAASSVAQAA